VAFVARRSGRFGLLRYANTGNLGDEIQSVAARRFLPRVDCLLDRDRLNCTPCRPTRPVRLIMNGWFTHHPENWPPHPAVRPLLVSLHLSDQMTACGFSAAEALVVGENAHWLREHGPIGARDLWTVDILRTNHIETWFSGCLTLTLQRPPSLARNDTIVINDMSDEVAAFVARRTTAPIVRTTHLEKGVRSFGARFALADELLRKYAQARCVITSRLHCALPCLALGTPVLLIPPPGSENRCAGFLDLIRNCSADELRTGGADFDLDEPPENPSRFQPLRDRLIQQCTAYTSALIT
jgi:hypothetical protein